MLRTDRQTVATLEMAAKRKRISCQKDTKTAFVTLVKTFTKNIKDRNSHPLEFASTKNRDLGVCFYGNDLCPI